MTDEAPEKTKTQRIIDELNRGEGRASEAAARLAALLAQRPQAALAFVIGWTLLMVLLGRWVST
jgi:predicted Zn-dependent protease